MKVSCGTCVTRDAVLECGRIISLLMSLSTTKQVDRFSNLFEN